MSLKDNNTMLVPCFSLFAPSFFYFYFVPSSIPVQSLCSLQGLYALKLDPFVGLFSLSLYAVVRLPPKTSQQRQGFRVSMSIALSVYLQVTFTCECPPYRYGLHILRQHNLLQCANDLILPFSSVDSSNKRRKFFFILALKK